MVCLNFPHPAWSLAAKSGSGERHEKEAGWEIVPGAIRLTCHLSFLSKLLCTEIKGGSWAAGTRAEACMVQLDDLTTGVNVTVTNPKGARAAGSQAKDPNAQFNLQGGR